jgi:hypothetical protein
MSLSAYLRLAIERQLKDDQAYETARRRDLNDGQDYEGVVVRNPFRVP